MILRVFWGRNYFGEYFINTNYFDFYFWGFEGLKGHQGGI